MRLLRAAVHSECRLFLVAAVLPLSCRAGIKKVWSPDPSNLMEFGVPLGTALKKELADALRNRSLEQFYAKWGNFFILGFTRGMSYN